jgi:hypothetical protein
VSRDCEAEDAVTSPARGIAALVVANSSLLFAGLVYMGWAYTAALYGYFHLNPLELGVGAVEYLLRSLSLFSSAIVFAAVVFIVLAVICTWDLNIRTHTPPRLASIVSALPLRNGRAFLTATGAALTALALCLAWLAYHFFINTYLILGLLGLGPLVLTWPNRMHRRGRLPYSLAIIVATVCALWAASLYAHNRGISAAKSLARRLPDTTAIDVYSIHPLALSGPGVTVRQLPKVFQYHYRYEGLRLLTERSGTYYLLPKGWSPQLDLTYILDDSDQVRIVLYSGERFIPDSVHNSGR